jgi:hypothetical protein
MEIKKVKVGGRRNGWVIINNGVEVGLITKATDTRTSLFPFQVYQGVGEGLKFLGSLYNKNQEDWKQTLLTPTAARKALGALVISGTAPSKGIWYAAN